MSQPLSGKPRWLKAPPPWSAGVRRVDALLRHHGMNTVCREANCPNRGECWEAGSAAFLILGPVCTRGCRFCNVQGGRPVAVDPREPERLALAAATLQLRHVVITSVTRDDLADGGAGQFAACLIALRHHLPGASVEVLVPDFRGKPTALATVLEHHPTIFNHNVETVPRLYGQVRPGASYDHSLALLQQAAQANTSDWAVKSGLMLGFGEERHEVETVMAALQRAGVTLLTIGQYLRPGPNHYPVARYWTPEEFRELAAVGREMGFRQVESHPLARSSYHAATTAAALTDGQTHG